MKDVRQISKKFKVSRVSVYKHFKDINANHNYDRYIVKKDGKLYFKTPLINAIVSSFDRSHVNTNGSKRKTISAAKYIEHLESEIQSLKIDKDKLYQANTTTKASVKRLEKLLSQQQQLQLSTQHENKRLKSNNKHLKQINGHVANQSTNPKHPVKRGFWSRFFNKW